MKFITRSIPILFLLFSCQKDYEIPDTGRKLVLNALIRTDSVIGINITQSMYITDSIRWLGSDTIDYAHVFLYENNIFIDSLLFGSHRPTYAGYDQIFMNYRSTDFIPSAGREYRLVVKAAGFPEVTASAIIPNLVPVEKVDTSVVELTGKFEEWESNIRVISNIFFTDPEDEENYYLFYVKYKINDEGAYHIALSCNDPVVEEKLNHGTIYFGVAFSDKSINGKRHRLSIVLNGADIGRPFFGNDRPTPPPFEPAHKTTLYFCLYSISKEYYNYIQTLNLFLKNYKNPLVEPTQVYSNVTGGYGIFAGAAVSSDSIIFTY